MKILDILRKLGIFRSGSVSGTYTSAKDMPTEFLMDDVTDAKKDLTTKKDLKNVIGAVAVSNQANSEKAGIGRKIFFWIMVAIGFFFLLGFLSSGFSFNFVVFLILWGGLLFLLKKFAFFGFYSFWLMIVITVVIFFFSLMIFPSSENNSGISGISGDLIKSHDKKIYDISDEEGTVKGTASFQIKEQKGGEKYFFVTYHFLFKDNFPMIGSGFFCNDKNSGKKSDGYEYVGNLLRPLSKEKSDSVGAFSPVYCNKDAMPEDLFSSNSSVYNCPTPPISGTVTDTFSANFSRSFYSLEEFLAANTYEVYDGSDAWVDDGKEGECSLDDDLAVSQGKKVRSYSFVLKDKK